MSCSVSLRRRLRHCGARLCGKLRGIKITRRDLSIFIPSFLALVSGRVSCTTCVFRCTVHSRGDHDWSVLCIELGDAPCTTWSALHPCDYIWLYYSVALCHIAVIVGRWYGKLGPVCFPLCMCILYTNFVLSVWEERKVRLYGEHANVHQSHSQNDSGDLRGVAGGDGELGCLCGKAGTSHLCDGSAHSSGCVVNGYGCHLSYCIQTGRCLYAIQICVFIQ